MVKLIVKSFEELFLCLRNLQRELVRNVLSFIVNSVKISLAPCLSMNLLQSPQHTGSLFAYNKCMKYMMWWQLFFSVVTKLFDSNKNRIKLIQNIAEDDVTAILPYVS